MVVVQFPEPTPPPPPSQAQASWDLLLPGPNPTSSLGVDQHMPVQLHFTDTESHPNLNLNAQQIQDQIHTDLRRNLGGAGRPSDTTTQNIVMIGPSSTVSGSSSSTSDKPFFPTGTELTPPNTGNNGNVTKVSILDLGLHLWGLGWG